MLIQSRSGPLDLLVVGGLTVDRFADGSSAPGGSVLHAIRAAAERRLRIGVVTAAGPEPEAQAGLAELHRLAAGLEVATHMATWTFRHRDSIDGRRLWLEQRGGPVAWAGGAPDGRRTRAILYAPVADEVDVAALNSWEEVRARSAILQGWLRSTGEDGEVLQRPLLALDDRLCEALGRLDLVVASREDLSAEGDAPSDQLAALRVTLGARPALVVTDGADGLWLDVGGDREHLPVVWLVEDVPTVGAGDVLATFLTMGAADPPGGWHAHAERAMRVVAEVLDGRKRR